MTGYLAYVPGIGIIRSAKWPKIKCVDAQDYEAISILVIFSAVIRVYCFVRIFISSYAMLECNAGTILSLDGFIKFK